MSTLQEADATDTAELQRVLTRYIDSIDGYKEAAEVVEWPSLSEAFLEIASRRKLIADHVATLIEDQGEKPDESGSPEAIIHRWWLRTRAVVSDEEFRTTLEECVRGEKELFRTVDTALILGNLDPAHAAIISEVATELKESLLTFESLMAD